MNIQQLLDSTSVNSTAILTGEITVSNGTTFWVPRPMSIVFADDAVIKYEGIPVNHLFDVSKLSGGRVEFINPRIHAQPSLGPSAGQGGVGAAIGWVLAKTPNTQLIVDGAKITGCWNAAVMRSGGGLVEIKRSSLEGWSAPIKVFESHKFGSGHRCIIIDCSLKPDSGGGTPDSIGMYIHPHISTTITNVIGEGFGRWVVYANGTMDGAGRWDLFNVQALNCSLIQSADGAGLTTLIRCRESGPQRNGGTQINGSVLSVESTWNGVNGLNLTPSTGRLTMIRDTFKRSAGFVIVAGRSVMANISLQKCNIELGPTDGRVALVSNTANSSVRLELIECEFNIAPTHTKLSELVKVCQGMLHTVGKVPGVNVVAPATWESD